MKRVFKILFLVLVSLLGPISFFLISSQGLTALNWLLPAAFFLWLFLFALWYLGFGSGTFLRRLGKVTIGIVGVVALGFIAGSVLRYEGSASGSSFPKFAWAWEEDTFASPAPKPLVQSGLLEKDQKVRDAAEDSNDFLGPRRNGMWPSLSFDPNWTTKPPELLWRRAVGKAWSSFVVSDGKAITQEQAGNAERVICLNLFTGEEIWHHDDPNTRLLLEREENSGARMGGDGPRSTPTIHEGMVYSIGATGIVNCLDLATGKRVWTHNVIRDYGGEIQRWGLANAPLIVPQINAVVFAGTDKKATPEKGVTLVAFDCITGAEKWVYRGSGASYSSPRLLSFFGEEQLITINMGDVAALNPETGAEIWKFEWKGNYPKVGQALKVGEDKLLVTSSYGMGSPLIQISRKDGKWSASQLWKSTRMKTKFSSAVILDGFAYGLDEGRLAAIDLETGDKKWKNQKYGFGQQLLLGNHLLIQTEKGPVVVGTVGPDGFTEISSLDALEGMTWNVPALAGRILLVRNDREAACYVLPEKQDRSPR